MTSRSRVIRSLVLAASLALIPAVGGAWALQQREAAEIRFTGGVWRGAIGDRIEVTFRDRGRDETVTGVLSKLERFAMTLEVDADGRTGRRVIILGDVRSVKLVEEGSGTATPAGSGGGSQDDAPEAPATPTTPGTPAPRASSRLSAMEVADNAGPITGPRADGKKTVFVLPLPGMVGTGLRHDEMEKLEKEMDKLGPGQIMVMRINSGGGLVLEGDRIHVSLQRIKRKHRLVAWIEEAISGAAFTALHADEIYFMDVGSLGAITMGGGGISIKGQQLDAWLNKIYEVCEIGGRPGFLCRCMVHSSFEASYDVDDETGLVTWHQDTTGQFVVSRSGDNLSFNATDAVRSGFAQGRANTEAELFEAMQLAPDTYVVSHVGKRIAEDWRRTQEDCKREYQQLLRDYQIRASGRDPEATLGIRINAIRRLIGWWDRAEPIMMYELNAPPKRVLEEMLMQLQKELSDLQRQRAQERRNRG
ncbi:MAG: hypothetical protein KF724_03835 [Phycisphaeraceae bacterium]|nr:hypothetical protein [Phycisphaeraceae bacterium]